MRRLPWEPVSDIQPDREGPEKAAWRWAAGHRGALGLGQRLHLVSFRAPPPSGRLGAHVSPEGLESARKLAVALVFLLMVELRMRGHTTLTSGFSRGTPFRESRGWSRTELLRLQDTGSGWFLLKAE